MHQDHSRPHSREYTALAQLSSCYWAEQPLWDEERREGNKMSMLQHQFYRPIISLFCLQRDADEPITEIQTRWLILQFHITDSSPQLHTRPQWLNSKRQSVLYIITSIYGNSSTATTPWSFKGLTQLDVPRALPSTDKQICDDRP